MPINFHSNNWIAHAFHTAISSSALDADTGQEQGNKKPRLWVASFMLISAVLQPAAASAQCDDRSQELTPTRDFTLNDDGTAQHTKTGLVWSRCSMGQVWQGNTCVGTASAHGFYSAFAQAGRANAENYLGFNTWRLPAIEELQSIVEFHCANPAINATVFPNTPASWYWSSSVYFEFPWYGQPVDFGNGTDEIFYKITYEAYPFPVRLVRNAKAFGSPALGVDTDDDGVNDVLEITQGMNPKLKDNDITRDDRFVAQLYRDLYYREANAGELVGELQLLKTNPNRVERLVALVSAPEYQQQQLNVAILLALEINNQIPARSWLNDWRHELEKSRSRVVLIDSYMQKSDLRESYLNAGNQEYIEALGARILGRSLTQQERQAGNASLQTMNRADFTAYWLTSPALREIPASQLLVIQIADLLADYPLDSETLSHYSQQLDNHTIALVELLKSVLNSAGYAKRFMQNP